jgi:hypothetical protein
MGGIQAIQEADCKTLFCKKGGQVQQAQGPGKKIVGREIVNPGVDEE